MEITSNKEEMIFRNERDGKISYSIGISKKKEDGTYEKGYIPIKFRKDVSLETQTKIRIKNAWLDFFKIDKKTIPYIFINEFEKVEQQEQEKVVEQKPIDNWEAGKNVEINDDDLPFYG